MSRNALNVFLTGTFNTILKAEEVALSRECPDLSVREIHVIDAVCAKELQGDNRVSAIAEHLGVTAGTLTVSLNTLEKKGYIKREKDPVDRRVVRVTTTGKGLIVNEIHKVFHDEMVAGILSAVPEEDLPVLIQALGSITGFFRSKYLLTEEEET